MAPRVLLVLALVLVAGCSDAPKADVPAGDDEVFADLEDGVQATATTGAIAGVVVDDAIRPIPGANVTLLARNQTVTADADGRFAFEELEAGVYFLSSVAHRHDTIQLSVEVKVGEIATARVMMQRLTTVEPYKQTVQFRGYVANYLGYPNFVVEVLAPGTIDCVCVFEVPVDGNLSTLVVEADGVSQVENPDSTVPEPYYEVFYDAADTGVQDSNYAEFPFVLRYEDDFVANQTAFVVRLTGGVSPVVRMDYDLYVTAFYHEAAPEGWSLLAGST